MEKMYFYRTALLTAILTSTSFGCKKEEPVRTEQTQSVQTQPITQEVYYTVKSGDYLWRISYRELGLRGEREIRSGVLRIQSLNPSILTDDRDTHYVDSNGNLVQGKDGLVDRIYPGERLRIK